MTKTTAQDRADALHEPRPGDVWQSTWRTITVTKFVRYEDEDYAAVEWDGSDGSIGVLDLDDFAYWFVRKATLIRRGT